MTESMTKQSQMIEQIFANIDIIGEKMEKTIDLAKDVAPFMSATLAKIKQLALAKEDAYEAQFELFQIATNYLPRTVNAYCALPIEYRNTREIKQGKNARQFLIEDLKIFKTQVLELEKQFYNSIESEIKVNSTVVRAKYENKFHLATELDNLGNDGFVDQFNFSEYKESTDYKNIVFKKEKTELDVQTEKKAKEKQEQMDKAKKMAWEATVYVGKKISFATKKFAALVIDSFENIAGNIIPPIIVVGIVVGFFYGMYALISSSERPERFYKSVVKESSGIHDVMAVSMVPTNEFATFSKTKAAELIDDNSYRQQRTTATYDSNAHVFILQVSGIAKNNCLRTIDQKELGFDNATMAVNGIVLPQDNIVSNYLEFKNENHNLCHLEEDNKITIQFDNQKIYDNAKKLKAMPEAEKKSLIDKMNAELTSMTEEMKKYKGDSSHFVRINSLSEQLKSNIELLKKLK